MHIYYNYVNLLQKIKRLQYKRLILTSMSKHNEFFKNIIENLDKEINDIKNVIRDLERRFDSYVSYLVNLTFAQSELDFIVRVYQVASFGEIYRMAKSLSNDISNLKVLLDEYVIAYNKVASLDIPQKFKNALLNGYLNEIYFLKYSIEKEKILVNGLNKLVEVYISV